MPGFFILVVTVLAVLTEATLDPDGVKCGDKRCATVEYCSPYDTQCRPCSIACDTNNRNRQPELCVKDCQGTFYYFLLTNNELQKFAKTIFS